jgi:hypothetical protein
MTRVACLASRWGLALSVLGAWGCYDVHAVDPGPVTVPIVADPSGWVNAASNPLGLAGVWYAYGDQYPTVPRCTEFGLHLADECSFVAWPDAWAMPEPGTGKFPNSGNRLCTYGDAAKVLGCADDATEWCVEDGLDLDYANMWGAGIGLQFDLSSDGSGGSGGAATTDPDAGVSTGWDAPGHGIIGVAFDLEWTDPSVRPDPFLRVEFPVVLPPEGLLLTTDTVDFNGHVWHAGESLPEGYTSEVHPSGSPFVDAPPVWGKSGVPNDPSLVGVGHNELFWSDAKGAPSNEKDYAYPFYPENLIGLQFHVPAIKDYRIPYGFCISNLAFLRK